MSHPYHHALSSVKKWGGMVEDYLPIHQWFDESKAHFCDYRHRAVRHHAEGIFECERVFGVTIEVAKGTPGYRRIPTRWVGEQHVKEDLGQIPTLQDWLRCIAPMPWMGKTTKLPEEKHDTRTGS